MDILDIAFRAHPTTALIVIVLLLIENFWFKDGNKLINKVLSYGIIGAFSLHIISIFAVIWYI